MLQEYSTDQLTLKFGVFWSVIANREWTGVGARPILISIEGMVEYK